MGGFALHLVSCKLQLSCSVSTWECDWPHKTILTSEVPSCQICQGENTACCLILTWRRSQRWVENPKGINSMAKGHCISVSDCLWAPLLGSMTLPREKLFRQEPRATGQHGSKKYSYSEFLTGLILLIFSCAKKMLRMFFGFPTYPLLLEWTLKNQRHLAKQTSLWLLRQWWRKDWGLFSKNCLHPLHRECYDQDMAPRISIKIVIWILLSLVTIIFGGQLYSSHTSYSPLGQSTAGHSPTKPCFPNGFDLQWDWVQLRHNLLTTFYKEISTGQQKINCSRCTGSAGYHLLSLHNVAIC